MPETIGQRLKQAREEKRLTLEKAAEATRVRLPYLQALENDDYSVMVSAAQGRGFLRLYADYLGLDLDEIVSTVKAATTTAAPEDSPALKAEMASEPIPAGEPPASPSTPKPARPGFWSRLLRRSVPAPEPEPQPEAPIETAASVTVEEKPDAPAVIIVETPVAEEPVKPAKKIRRPASESEPKKKPRAAASKKKLSI